MHSSNPAAYGPSEITIGHATPLSYTSPAGQQQREGPTSGAAASYHGAPRRSQRVAADRP
jgi:hypothetical protein